MGQGKTNSPRNKCIPHTQQLNVQISSILLSTNNGLYILKLSVVSCQLLNQLIRIDLKCLYLLKQLLGHHNNVTAPNITFGFINHLDEHHKSSTECDH